MSYQYASADPDEFKGDGRNDLPRCEECDKPSELTDGLCDDCKPMIAWTPCPDCADPLCHGECAESKGRNTKDSRRARK